MKNLSLNQIRELFLSFYQNKEHYRRESFPLVPKDDKSLLIINSGMAPLKAYFAGTKKPPAPRMTTCQKCIRTADIENVGLTARHGTFFEMLGSFSFGDYFKEESIKWGYEFLTDVLQMPIEKLWVSIYQDDDEAYNIWKEQIGFPTERIVRLGKDDNFWEIGTGPCGPCSEIYFDRGDKYNCDNPDCKPGCDCDRFIEFWNHVFTQFNKTEEGNYEPLEHPNIDTGMGLERIACIMQGVDSIFDVDTIKAVLDRVCEIAKVKYGDGKFESDVSVRIITDHIRSATFMISDGIMPSNESRGYVLRRLIRRAIRHGRKLGIQGNFLSSLIDVVISTSGNAYPEITTQEVFIRNILTQEEEKFSNTLNQGLQMINSQLIILKENNDKIFPPDLAFKLHDTYGFPFEITEEILAEEGMKVSKEDFDKYMLVQKNLGKTDAEKKDFAWEGNELNIDKDIKTEFIGYNFTASNSKVLYVSDNKDFINKNKILAIFDKTPFYATGGGQKSDIGIIKSNTVNGTVIGVQKINDAYIHEILLSDGKLSVGDTVELEIDIINRNNSARNHTVTHILHQALKDILGEHINQAGSSLDANGLTFDFTHFKALSADELEKLSNIVNEKIDSFLPVNHSEMSLEEAKKKGAIGLFDDKYGDVVRVLTIGDYSIELCGGTHITNTGQIGSFKILSERGISSGVRRIEAVTSCGIRKLEKEKEEVLNKLSTSLKINKDDIVRKVEQLQNELEEKTRELTILLNENQKDEIDNMLKNAIQCNTIKLITKKFNDVDVQKLKDICDKLRDKESNLAIVLAIDNGEKSSLIVALSKDIIKDDLKAGMIIKDLAKIGNGGGGGKPDMAQAGIKLPEKIDEIFAMAKNIFINK